MYRLINNLITRVFNTISPFALAPVPQDISLLSSCDYNQGYTNNDNAVIEAVDPSTSDCSQVDPAPVAKCRVYGIEDHEYDDDDDDDADAPIIGVGPITYTFNRCVDDKDVGGVSSVGGNVGGEESAASVSAVVAVVAAADVVSDLDHADEKVIVEDHEEEEEVFVPVGCQDRRFKYCFGCNAFHSVRGGDRGCFGVGRRDLDADSVAESAAVDYIALSNRRTKRAHSDAFEDEQCSRQQKKQNRSDVEEMTLLRMVLLNESRKLKERVDAEIRLFAPCTLVPTKRKMEGQGEGARKYRKVL